MIDSSGCIDKTCISCHQFQASRPSVCVDHRGGCWVLDRETTETLIRFSPVPTLGHVEGCMPPRPRPARIFDDHTRACRSQQSESASGLTCLLSVDLPPQWSKIAAKKGVNDMKRSMVYGKTSRVCSFRCSHHASYHGVYLIRTLWSQSDVRLLIRLHSSQSHFFPQPVVLLIPARMPCLQLFSGSPSHLEFPGSILKTR